MFFGALSVVLILSISAQRRRASDLNHRAVDADGRDPPAAAVCATAFGSPHRPYLHQPTDADMHSSSSSWVGREHRGLTDTRDSILLRAACPWTSYMLISLRDRSQRSLNGLLCSHGWRWRRRRWDPVPQNGEWAYFRPLVLEPWFSWRGWGVERWLICEVNCTFSTFWWSSDQISTFLQIPVVIRIFLWQLLSSLQHLCLEVNSKIWEVEKNLALDYIWTLTFTTYSNKLENHILLLSLLSLRRWKKEFYPYSKLLPTEISL